MCVHGSTRPAVSHCCHSAMGQQVCMDCATYFVPCLYSAPCTTRPLVAVASGCFVLVVSGVWLGLPWAACVRSVGGESRVQCKRCSEASRSFLLSPVPSAQHSMAPVHVHVSDPQCLGIQQVFFRPLAQSLYLFVCFCHSSNGPTCICLNGLLATSALFAARLGRVPPAVAQGWAAETCWCQQTGTHTFKPCVVDAALSSWMQHCALNV